MGHAIRESAGTLRLRFLSYLVSDAALCWLQMLGTAEFAAMLHQKDILLGEQARRIAELQAQLQAASHAREIIFVDGKPRSPIREDELAETLGMGSAALRRHFRPYRAGTARAVVYDYLEVLRDTFSRPL